MLRLILSAAVVAACSALAGHAAAATVVREYLSHGVANCQSALPVFDGNIRKRPKALANEGTSVAFVTCDFDSIDTLIRVDRGTSAFYVIFNNRSGFPATVNCTFVNGWGDTVYSPSLTRSVSLGSAAREIQLGVTAGDNGGGAFVAPSISCALPPGVEIMGVGQRYQEDIGF